MRIGLAFSLVCIMAALLLACAPGSPVQTQAPKTPQATTTTATSPAPAPSVPGAPATPKAITATSAVSFEGKTVTMIVPLAPGGGTDTFARVYTRHFPRFLPGNPSMIVRNMPGGATSIGVNYVYNVSKPDGLTLLATSTAAQVNQLLGMKAVKYDFMKMPILIGSPGGSVYYFKSGIVDRSEDILQAKGVIFGGTPGSLAYMFILAKELVGFPLEKVVAAYASSGEVRRAFLSGETNAGYDSENAYLETIAPMVTKGQVVPIFQTGIIDQEGNVVKHPLFPDIPTLPELHQKVNGKAASGMAWDAFKAVLAASKSYDYIVTLPPGTPAPIVNAYWGAAEAMIKDPEFIKVSDLMIGKGARWGAGESYEKGFQRNFGMKPEVRDWLLSTLPKYGLVVE